MKIDAHIYAEQARTTNGRPYDLTLIFTSLRPYGLIKTVARLISYMLPAVNLIIRLVSSGVIFLLCKSDMLVVQA